MPLSGVNAFDASHIDFRMQARPSKPCLCGRPAIGGGYMHYGSCSCLCLQHLSPPTPTHLLANQLGNCVVDLAAFHAPPILNHKVRPVAVGLRPQIVPLEHVVFDVRPELQRSAASRAIITWRFQLKCKRPVSHKKRVRLYPQTFGRAAESPGSVCCVESPRRFHSLAPLRQHRQRRRQRSSGRPATLRPGLVR